MSEKRLHENMQKTLRTTHNLFSNWAKSTPSGKKTVPFLMRSCSIQCLVLHSGNDHMQNSTSCDVRLCTWRRIKLVIWLKAVDSLNKTSYVPAQERGLIGQNEFST